MSNATLEDGREFNSNPTPLFCCIILLLPAGKRRDNLATAAEQMFNEDLAVHSLAFDGNCATEYALLVAERARNGHTISTEDGQIAAIALSHDLSLATRNGKDFKGIEGLTLLNPWK
jgi:hypothetical protein